MKNKPILIIFLLVISIILIVVLATSKSKEKVEINTESPVQTEEIVVSDSFETKFLNPDDTYVKFDVKYPYFKNADKDFNLKIETLIKSQIEDDIKLSEENWQARYDTQTAGENIPKTPKNDEDKFYFFSNFTIIQSNSSYISFVLKYGGFNGGAHGYENITSFNYDVKNKKIIELKDIFSNNSQYLNYISTKSRDYLKKEFATVSEEDKKNSAPEAIKEYINNIVEMIESGTEPKEENFWVFTFTKDKIRIYFAQYQVGPYVIGMPEVEIDIK